MDESLPVEWQSDDLFWFEAPLAVRQITAFVPYSNRNGPTDGFRQENNTAGNGNLNFQNINMRMIEFCRKSRRGNLELAAGGDLEREKCHRHMMNERMRREKQKQSYLALHSMLPKGTKNDKNSIVQMATRTIQELKAYEAMLQRRNLEMELNLAAERERENGTVIRLRVANPSSGINSMLAVLNFLKNVGVNARAMHTSFSDSEFSSQLVIDTQMGAAEVERALQMTLSEVERKFPGHCKEDRNL